MSARGKATIQRIVDIDPFALQLGFLLPGASLEALGKHRAALDGAHVDWAAGAILLAVQSHLVRAGGKTILIDTCVGEHKQRPARADWHNRGATRYLANLKACGCTPDDVDIVMCTHLHADHVGWNTRLENGQWVPTFPNARYLMSMREVEQRASEAAAKPEANHGSYQDSVLPVLDRGAAAFVDAGDAFTRQYDTNVGAGIGLRWKSPVGLVRLDIARPLVSNFDHEWRVHLIIGPDL